jgi:hypothetical protein
LCKFLRDRTRPFKGAAATVAPGAIVTRKTKAKFAEAQNTKKRRH